MNKCRRIRSETTPPLLSGPVPRFLGAAAALTVCILGLQIAPGTPAATQGHLWNAVPTSPGTDRLRIRSPLQAEEFDSEVLQEPNASWRAAVMEEVGRQLYAASPTARGLEAANPAHDIQTTFGKQGLAIVPHATADAPPAWRFTWETRSLGRPGRMREALPASPEVEGTRVTYQRVGWSEWYENSASGLEQGFTLERRPEGNGPLQIAGRIPGALRPEVRPDGAIDFIVGKAECALRYGELHAWDAKGVELPAELTVAEDELVIVVDDREAIYPVTIDPMFTSPQWTNEPQEAYANHGLMVGGAGDVNGDGFADAIVVTAWRIGSAGWAFVFHGSMSGLSTVSAWSANFGGTSAASTGDVNGDGFSDVIVGGAERVYVYHGSANGLAATPAWTAESDQASAGFGSSVATAGDVNNDGYDDVIVGAQFYANGQVNEGRAFVFHGSESGLALAPAWNAECDFQAANFGSSVAGAGDVNGDGYDDVIVGAYRYSNPEGWEGAAFVYLGSATGLASTPHRTFQGNQVGAELGNSVAGAGDVNGDGYDDVVIGAHQYDDGQNNEGLAFVSAGSLFGLGALNWSAQLGQGAFGWSVAGAGDVNGDGYDDIIVGAKFYGNGQAQEGGAFVYFGSANFLAYAPSWSVEGNQLGASLGFCVGTAGDVNGDGLSDVIIGAPFYDHGQEDEGRAFLYHGGLDIVTSPGPGSDYETGDFNNDGILDLVSYNSGGISRVCLGNGVDGIGNGHFTESWSLDTSSINATQAAVADFDLDGHEDIALSTSSPGKVCLFRNTGSGYALDPTLTVPLIGRCEGVAVADMNQDGILDFVVCLDSASGVPDRGGVQFYWGGGQDGVWDGTFSAGPQWFLGSGTRAHKVLIRDFNQDGYPDLAIAGNKGSVMRFQAGGQTGTWEIVCETSSGPDTQGLASGDFNESGQLDLVFSRGRGLAVRFKNTNTAPVGGGSWFTFVAGFNDTTVVLPSTPGDIAVLDYDRDGLLDMAAAFDSLGIVQFYRGHGTYFDPPATYPIAGHQPGLPLRLAVGDFVTNGSPDLVVGQSGGGITVLPSVTSRLPTGLTLMTPNGGEVWPQATAGPAASSFGSASIEMKPPAAAHSSLGAAGGDGAFPPGIAAAQQIAWTKGAGVDGVDVAISRDDGVSWQTIAIDHPGSSMTWIVTPPATSQARIRVADTAVASRTDASDGTFTIPLDTSDTSPEDPQDRIAAFTMRDRNPVRSVARFSMMVPVDSDVQVEVFDARGRLVRTLVRGTVEAGSHQVDWDGRDAHGTLAPRGLYFVRARIGSSVIQRKVVALW